MSNPLHLQRLAERRYSGTWDHRTAVPPAVMEDGAEQDGNSSMNRMHSTPHRDHEKPNLRKISAPPKSLSRRPTKLISDDGSLEKFSRKSGSQDMSEPAQSQCLLLCSCISSLLLQECIAGVRPVVMQLSAVQTVQMHISRCSN